MSTGGGPGDSSFDYVAHDQKTATNLGKKSKDMPTKTNYDKAIKNEHDKAVQNDNRSMSERLADVQKGRNAKDIGMMGESKDPTQAAMMHGNQPSKGAKIDKELMEEDEKYLKQKGKA